MTVGGFVTNLQPGSISDTKVGSITFLYLGIFPMIVLRCLFIEIIRPGGAEFSALRSGSQNMT